MNLSTHRLVVGVVVLPQLVPSLRRRIPASYIVSSQRLDARVLFSVVNKKKRYIPFRTLRFADIQHLLIYLSYDVKCPFLFFPKAGTPSFTNPGRMLQC